MRRDVTRARDARTDGLAGLLRRLIDGGVEFILVGGLAGNVHGVARSTFDVDVVYRRTRENILRIVEALAPIDPYLRGAPPGLPFVLDADTILRGLNFTLRTSLGDIDLLGEVVVGGSYERLLPETVSIELFGTTCRCIGLPALIRLKRAAGRPKDLEAIAELKPCEKSATVSESGGRRRRLRRAPPAGRERSACPAPAPFLTRTAPDRRARADSPCRTHAKLVRR